MIQILYTDRESSDRGDLLQTGNRPLERLFNGITISYDRMNRLLTLGMDQRWRRRAAGLVAEFDPDRVLDLCTGTGDLAFLLAKTLKEGTRITGLDYSPHMLEQAQKKRPSGRNYPDFVLGDAAALPFPADSFDTVTISFAFRNLTYHNPRMKSYLSEIRRVLKPDGIFVIIESAQPNIRIIRKMRDLYVEIMVGKIVSSLSGHRSAYRYLADSVKRYFSPEEIGILLRSAGFSSVEYAPLFFGAVGLYRAHGRVENST